MQDNTKKSASVLPAHGNVSFYFSLLLLILSIGWSIGLYSYNIYLSKKIQTEQSLIAETERKIAEISKDRDVLITKIVSANTIRPSLDLRTLVAQFRDAATQANVRLKGFSVNKDTITTSLKATEGDASIHPDPAATIIRMMRDYTGGSKYFLLDPIVSFSGDEKRRTTAISFHVSPISKK